jgi:hypothetical protein
MATDKSVYFAKYYKKNRPAILAKRRIRYKNDPEYRIKMQEKARERARLKAEERRKQKVVEIQQHADNLRQQKIDLDSLGSQKVKRWPVGDFVTASVVAEALDVSLGTLGNWIRGGIIPQPTISSTAGKHLFSVDYLSLVRECRIEALSQGLVNGEFGKLVNSRYASIKENEQSLRKGGLD